jgi:hypothetical protein
LALLGASLGAAPAPPSYYGVADKIAKIEAGWANLSDQQNPYGAGWRAFFQGVRADLGRYTSSEDPEERIQALNRLHQMSLSLQASRWPAAIEVREELRAWLRPRVTLAWAEYRVLEALTEIPADQAANRAKWKSFVEEVLRPSLHNFEVANTVTGRIEAQERVRAAIDALRKSNQVKPWSKSVALEIALNELYSVPNVEIVLDRTAVNSAVLPQGIVEPGWIFFKGQWSYVTPGPIVGIGFVPTADGIQVSISQSLTSVTPIQGFQQQVAQDPQGRRAANLYQFSATSQNNAVLTITALFRLTTGIQLAPGYQHGISATVGSAPQAGKGLGRFVASLVGYGQRRITNEVYEGAIPKIQQQVVEGSSELAGIKASQKAADLNARVRPYVLDSQTVGVDRFRFSGLSLQTLSDHATMRGTFVDVAAGEPRRASMPQPRSFHTYQPGVSVDVHLPSALSTGLQGFLASDAAKNVTNIMIVTTENPDNPGRPEVVTRTNVDYPTYLAEVEKAQARQDRKAQAIRVFKPQGPLTVETDSAGNLVLLVNDFTIDVPAPPQAARGGALTGPAAKVYRIRAQNAEFSVGVSVKPAAGAEPGRVTGKVADFDPGPQVEVLAINEDEGQASPLNAFTGRIIATAFRTRIVGLPFEAPINQLANAQVALASASAIDPSGWMRIVLSPR